MIDLTIAIPTYNRKERLIRALRSLVCQPLFSETHLLILNNCSNYDVEGTLISEFGESALSNMRVINHPYNLGLSLNISLPFYYCKTKWLWIMSDDDEALPQSLSVIKRDMNAYSDEIVVKYSLAGASQHDNRLIRTLQELVEYYDNENQKQGELIFISNAIYNINKLQPVLGDCINYSYNIVAGINPMLFGLDKSVGACFFSEDHIVNYLQPAPGSGWSLQNVMTRVANIQDYPFESDGKTVKSLMSLMHHIGFKDFMKVCFSINDKDKIKIFFDKTFYKYIYTGGFVRANAKLLIFYIYYYTGLTLVK